LSTDKKKLSATKSTRVNSLTEKAAKVNSDLSDQFVVEKIGQCEQRLTSHR